MLESSCRAFVCIAGCAGCTLLVSTGDLSGGGRSDGTPAGDGSAAAADASSPLPVDAGGADGSIPADAGSPTDPRHVVDAESVTSAGGGAVTATFASEVAAGDTLVCFSFANAADATVTSFTDSAGDDFVRVDAPIGFAAYTHELWYVSKTKGGVSLSVTVVSSASGVRRGVSCHEYEGSLAVVGSRSSVYAGDGPKAAAPLELPAPLTTGIAFVFWGSFKGVSVGSEWTKRSSLDGDYIGDRAIRAGTSLVMGATCAGDCVMLGGVFAR